MASVQLNFTLRTTATVKTVHLLGSWDNYQGQLPLSRDATKKSSSGAWAGTFRFQPGTLQPGARYWYYYIMDGYHVTHDPARESVVEPTTQRKLNTLDIPASAAKTTTTSTRTARHSRRESTQVAKGRSLSPSKIISPRPQRPGQTKQITTEQYTTASLSEIEARLGRATLSDSEDDSDSDEESDCPSLSRSSNASSPSSMLSSSSTSSSCSCERYGITRSGNRIKLDCGGSRCGYSDDSCEDSEEEEVDTKFNARSTRRHGVVIRGR